MLALEARRQDPERARPGWYAYTRRDVSCKAICPLPRPEESVFSFQRHVARQVCSPVREENWTESRARQLTCRTIRFRAIVLGQCSSTEP